METRSFSGQEILSKCPACLSSNISQHKIAEDFHYGNEGIFNSDRCLACETVFMNPMPSVDDLVGLYPNDYYSYQPPTSPSFKKRLSNLILQHPRKTHLPRFPQPGVMLDVGCGAGHYLFEMRKIGWTVYGSELSKAAADAGAQAGLDIRSGELTEANFESSMFDFVRSNHSLEHIPNPDIILKEMRRILKEDGKLFIGVPNVGGFFARMFGKYWWNYGLPVHVINYTPKGLRSILERNGFRVSSTFYNSDYSGLTGSAQILINSRSGTNRSSGKIYDNKALRVVANITAKAFDLIQQGDCIEIIAVK